MTNAAPSILHVPCNTPYVKKIEQGNDFLIANGRSDLLPYDIDFQSIVDHSGERSFWNLFDACHIHYGFEFEKYSVVSQAVKEMRKHLKPIVFTCHELSSVHGIPSDEYRKYLQLMLQEASAIITLSNDARNALKNSFSLSKDIAVVPHGKVVDPFDNPERRGKTMPTVLQFGALRSNKEIIATLINSIFGTDPESCNLSLITRPFSSRQLAEDPSIRSCLQLAQGDIRTKIETVLPLSNDELYRRVSAADILVLPYAHAGHSGQLELAFDLGLLPITTNIGFLRSQTQEWPEEYRYFTQSVAADWSDGKRWLYQARLIDAIRRALHTLPHFQKTLHTENRQEFRKNAHTEFLESHSAIYSSVLS